MYLVSTLNISILNNRIYLLLILIAGKFGLFVFIVVRLKLQAVSVLMIEG
jgi:hypothetical protein